MFRKIASVVVSLAIGLSPMSASAQGFVFRYKSGLSDAAAPQNPDPDFGVGNDIQAWFVAAVGYPFLKEIPVATNDVKEWTKDSGQIPAGIGLDTTTGVISGTATREEDTETTWYGLDSSGKRVARAQMHFSAFEPVGQVTQVNWYTHKGEYFYSQIPAPAGIDVVRWDPIVDFPEAMGTRNGAFEGRPAKPGSYGIAWRGYDYMGREVAFTYGEFLVQDGPVVEHIEDQVADRDLSETFEVLPVVKHAIGTITYALKPVEARPAGLTFSSTTGKVGGVFDDFGVTAKFFIEARDSGSGRVGRSNEFSLTTLPEALDLSAMPNLFGVAGLEFKRRIAHSSPAARYDVIEGRLPEGITLDRETGHIQGVPKQPELQEGIRVSVSGDGVVPAESNRFDFRIYSYDINATAEPLHVRVGTPFRTQTPTITRGIDPPYTYSASAALPEGIAFDSEHGQFHSDGVGVPGAYDQRVGVSNLTGHAVGLWQIIRVYDNPALAYPAISEGARLSDVVIAPQLKAESVREPARYTLVQGKLPSFLKLDQASGTIHGSPREMSDIGEYGPFVVSLVDAFGETPVLSNPFNIRIVDRPAVEIEQASDKARRWVVNQTKLLTARNAVNGFRFVVTDRSTMPSTLDINGDGYLVGTTTDDVGTVYSNVAVEVVDSLGYKDDIKVSIEVVEPGEIGGIDGGLDRTIPWTVGRDFVGLTAPRVQNTYGQVTYSLGSNDLGLSIDQTTLELSGKAQSVGIFEVPYTVADETGREPAQGTLTFVIRPSMTAYQHDVEANRGGAVSITPTRTNGIAPFEWRIAAGSLPAPSGFAPMTFDSTTGAIAGKPREEGDFPLVLEVVDRTGQKQQVSFVLKVAPPLPFRFSFGGGWMTLGQNSAVYPAFENRSEAVAWTHISGVLPKDVKFETAGPFAGMFRGYPSEDGVFGGIVIRGVDTGTGQSWTETATLRIRRTGSIRFPSATLKHRVGDRRGEFAFGATNVTEPLKYEIIDNAYPDNVSIDPATGELSAAFPLPGRYAVNVKVTDLFDRTHTAKASFDVVGDLSVTVRDPAQFKRFSEGSVPVTVKNLIGNASYSASGLPSTLTAGEGTISGTPDIVESLAGATVTVTDSYDGTAATSNAFTLVVAERDTLKLVAPDYETNQYKPVGYRPTVSNAIGDVAWTISPPLPDDLAFDPATGRIAGTLDEVFEQSFTLTATDSKGAPLGQDSTVFDLRIVEREAPELTNSSPLVAILDKPYVVTLGARNILGTAVWEHVSGDLPSGLSFDPATRRISGVPTEFGMVSDILIRITDTYKGIKTVGEKLISIDVKQDGSPIDFSLDGPVAFRVGEFYQSPAPVASNSVGDVEWKATGLEGTGLVIDPLTGVISGTPTAAGALNVVVTVSDITGRERGRDVPISILPEIEIVFPKENALLYNYTFEKLAEQSSKARSLASSSGVQPQAGITFGEQSWTILPAAGLPAGLTFDSSTGKFLGKPLQLGEFGPFEIVLKDGLPGQAALQGVMLVVTMNDDPIDLAVSEYVTKIGYPIRTPAAVYDNALGDVRFFPENNDLGGTNLALDTNTGVLTGSFSTAQDRNINVAVADQYTTRVTSRPLHLQVLPELVLTGPERAVLEAQAPVTPAVVTPTNVAGTLVWADLDEEQKELLPEGIRFDTASGSFVGTTEQLGTYGPFRVKATDRFHGHVDEAVSNDIVLEVKRGALFLKLTGTALPDGKKFVPLTWYPTSQLDVIGVDQSEVRWSWSAPQEGMELPPGLSLNGTSGLVSGTPQKDGDFTFELTATGKGRESTAVFTLHVEPADYELELKDPGNLAAVSWKRLDLDLRSLISLSKNVDANAISWKVSNIQDPSRIGTSGWSFYGTFTHAGEYVFKVEAKYTNGTDVVTAETDLKVAVTDPPEQAWYNWTIRFTGNVAGRFEYTGAHDARIAELQLYDEAGNRLVPRDVYTYYHGWNAEAAWDGDPSTSLLDGLGSALVFEFPQRVIVKKVRVVMTGTDFDITSIQSMRSDVAGWVGGGGWLQHSSDYQPLPKPASGGKSYAAGEVVEFELWPGQ